MEQNNQINKSNKIKIIVITALIFLVSIAGISYAYFTVQVTGNDTASSMRLSTANLSLVYNDVQIASGDYIIPGWTQTKTLSVTNNGNVTVDYIIKFREIQNTIINGELVLSATCSSSSGTCDALPERAVPAATTEITDTYMYGPISIAPGVTHTYTLTAEFKDTGSNQNYNQNKYFSGTLNIGDGTATKDSCFTTSGTTTLTITGYTCSDTDIIIPSTINGKTVVAIDGGSTSTGAFSNKGLTSVVIPSSVTTINAYAFYTNQLTTVVIPNGVTTIDQATFHSNQLISVTIPDSVTTINSSAFGTNQLVSITIPSSVTTIGNYAFKNNQLTSVVIPSSVMTIGNQAFYGSTSADRLLTSVTIHGKSSSGDFTSYGTNVWGWASGYSDSNIVWTGSAS